MYKKLLDIHSNPRSDAIIRIADGAFIPVDVKNEDYQRYVAWVAAGNSILPA